MTHLEIENLASEYVERQLDVKRQAEVEEHLAACAGCRELVSDVRRVFEMCRAAGPIEPPPWLVPKIMRATVGERRPGFSDRVAAWFRPVLRARVVYVLAMAVFSLSMLANVGGVNLRHVKAQDLNPRNWIYQADRNGHLLLGRAEKYYYDLKVVYEIESRLRELRTQPSDERPQPKAPAGGTTEGAPTYEPALAFLGNRDASFDSGGPGRSLETLDGSRSARSINP